MDGFRSEGGKVLGKVKVKLGIGNGFGIPFPLNNYRETIYEEGYP